MKLFGKTKNPDSRITVSDPTLPPSLPSISAPLKAACDRVQQARHDHDQIATALTQARATRDADEIAHESSIARLATVESDHALESEAGAVAANKAMLAARAEFIATRDTLEFSQARVVGLEAKLTIASGNSADTERSQQLAWDEWVTEQLDEYHQEYQRAAAAFMSVVDRGLAVALALSHGTTYLTLRRTAIPRTASSRNSLITRSSHDAWRANSDAVALHSALVAIRQDVFGGGTLEDVPSLASESTAEPPSQSEATVQAEPVDSGAFPLIEI